MKKYNVKTIMKSVLRILVCVAVVALLTGVGFINSLMFHPEFCKGGDHNSLVEDIGFENYYKLIEEFVDADNSATKNIKGTKEKTR